MSERSINQALLGHATLYFWFQLLAENHSRFSPISSRLDICIASNAPSESYLNVYILKSEKNSKMARTRRVCLMQHIKFCAMH